MKKKNEASNITLLLLLLHRLLDAHLEWFVTAFYCLGIIWNVCLLISFVNYSIEMLWSSRWENHVFSGLLIDSLSAKEEWTNVRTGTLFALHSFYFSLFIAVIIDDVKCEFRSIACTIYCKVKKKNLNDDYEKRKMFVYFC